MGNSMAGKSERKNRNMQAGRRVPVKAAGRDRRDSTDRKAVL